MLSSKVNTFNLKIDKEDKKTRIRGLNNNKLYGQAEFNTNTDKQYIFKKNSCSCLVMPIYITFSKFILHSVVGWKQQF